MYIHTYMSAGCCAISGVCCIQGMLVGVTGKVGSGKSSLLAAITAEMTRLHGQVYTYISTLHVSTMVFWHTIV